MPQRVRRRRTGEWPAPDPCPPRYKERNEKSAGIDQDTYTVLRDRLAA
ncbi:hypothetical protein R1T08_37785 [Streptomyces sp. SBC-4]|nr:hypothetical protein [Streptomyces sp. SBC-4]MDV5149710.1 hypothetical protein [Streptomyces sp. SBC-4]